MINIWDEENVVVLKHESGIKIAIWMKYDSKISSSLSPSLSVSAGHPKEGE